MENNEEKGYYKIYASQRISCQQSTAFQIAAQ